MEFQGLHCASCHKELNSGVDSVVCPVCGAPFHRECYDEIGHCAFESQHGDGFEYQDERASEPETEEHAWVTCPKCSCKNQSGIFFCKQCGFPLVFNQTPFQNQQGQNDAGNGMPFPTIGMPFMPSKPLMDPMTGFNPQEQVVDNVTEGDLAKYVKINIPYYILMFRRIRQFASTRFNFLAFFFNGAWLMYRKMYKLGAVISFLIGALTLAQNLITMFYTTPILNIIADKHNIDISTMSGQVKAMDYVPTLSPNDQLLVYLPSILSIVSFIIMLLVGAFANKLYYKHCISEIKKIKASSKDENESKEKLQTAGGVNNAVFACLFICYMIIFLFPMLIS
ncbi:MAG: RING finger protein [Bacillota bacterium]|nr:RING finger protein [Bacillota bacterium]